MKLYDTSSKNNIKLEKKEINIYVCGPTVYDHVHIGNIRPSIIFDVLFRYLKYKNKEVNYVSNITDIDDKIIDRSIRENIGELELSDFYFNEYVKILDELNIIRPTHMPKVTDNINEIIKFIEKMVDDKKAYQTKNGIYFDTSKIKEYGIISGNKIEDNISNKNSEDNDFKKNISDFALWKKTNIGIMWDSKFGKGRPGWHTECVVLLNKYIGLQADIHGGGIDLRFPHHENENAQSVACNQVPLSMIWSHVGHLMVDSKKMAKSLNNFITARDLLKNYNSNNIRWMFYQVGYGKPFNYTKNLIEESKNMIDKMEVEINRIICFLIINNSYEKKKIFIDDSTDAYFENNLDLPNVVMSIQNKLKESSKLMLKKEWKILNDEINKINSILEVLGIKFKWQFTEDIIHKIKEWNLKLIEKKYNEADMIRSLLIKNRIL